jgi:hypothetical protein
MFSINTSFLNKEYIPFFRDHTIALSDRQFAHRLTPAYLDNTHIAGTSSSASARHWISLLQLWIDSEDLFLPFKISKKDLLHLQTTLQSYLETLQHYEKIGPHMCKEAAKKTLQDIQDKFQKNRICYTPLGYAAGVKNQGHSIPLKLTHLGGKIEALFLNLGEGVEMHPFLDWSVSTERYHFQSFPVMIEPKTLFSERGQEAFTRLILLQCVECPEKVRPYSAQDVYGVIYALGTIQSSFHTQVENRNCKPQLGDICADMAITLIIKDVLIDRGYAKEEIQRVFLLEKMSDILFFHQTLEEKGDDIDQWTLLKNGIQEFAIQCLKSNSNVVSEKEVEEINQTLQSIVSQVTIQIKKKRQTTISKPFQSLHSANYFLLKSPRTCTKHAFFQKSHQPLSDPRMLPKIEVPNPENVADLLFAWSKEAHALRENGEFLKGFRFVCSAFATLPVPQLKESDFWDLVSEEKIDAIIQNLSLLTADSAFCDPSVWKIPFYPQLSILFTGYAIADKLARRKYACLKGFASPFYPSRHTLCCFFYHQAQLSRNLNSFDFLFLPLEPFNSRWIAIRDYFETVQTAGTRTLFALESTEIDLKKAVEDFKKGADFFKAESDLQGHLKFLELFLDSMDSSMTLEAKLKALWLNEESRYIPQSIETLYCFAHHAWFCFKGSFSEMNPKRVSRDLKEPHTIVIRLPKWQPLNLSAESTLGNQLSPICQFIIDKAVTENCSQCLDTLPPEADRTWSIAILRQWMRIFSNQSLTITSVIQWMRQNISLMGEKDFQQLIEISLFKPGLLARKLKQEPHILKQLRSVISHALQHFNALPHHLNTIHFLVCLGVCVETYDASPCLATLKTYEAVLLNGKSYSLLIFLYQIGLPSGLDSLCELLKACFWVNYHEAEKMAPWLEVETLSPLQKYSIELEAATVDTSWREHTFKEVLQLILPDQNIPMPPCTGKYPYLRKGDYTLNLERGLIYKGDAQLFFLNQDAQNIIDSLGTNLVWNQDLVFYASNHSCKFVKKSHGGWTFFRKFSGNERWFEKREIPLDWEGIFPLRDSHVFDFWASQNKIFICHKNETFPLYVIEMSITSSKECHVFKLNTQEHSLRLVNIWTNFPLSHWFERLGSLAKTCVWANDNGIIKEFEILDLNLRFKADDTSFRCLNYPEFFLSDEQSLNALSHFEGSLVLENLRGKKWVLLPARTLKPCKGDFTTRVYFTETFINEKMGKIFLFQLDPLENDLLSPKPEANLFLSLLFAMQRQYAQALHYLNKAHDFQSILRTCAAIVDQFLELKDHSPEALAFYLRFFLFLLSHSKQMTLEGYGKEKSLPDPFYQWTAEQFANYLRIHSAKEVCRIPCYIRLTPEEELLILTEIKTHQGSRTVLNLNFAEGLMNSVTEILKPRSYWRPLFDIRLSLLQKGKWSSTIGNRIYPLFSPDQLFTLMKDFSQINTSFPNYVSTVFQTLVRFTQRDLCDQFVHLYRKAREGKGEFDLFFLMRSPAEIGQPSYLLYALVLRYVQKFPHEFKGLDFKNDPIADAKVFTTILERAGGKLAKIWQTASSIQTMLGEQRIQFNYRKSIQLTLNPPNHLSPLRWQLKPEETRELIKLAQEVYHHFLKVYLDVVQEPLVKENIPFPFTQMEQTFLSFTSQELLLQLKKGHTKLLDPKYGKTTYRLKEGTTAQACLQEAAFLLDQSRQGLTHIKNHAEAIANDYPEIAYRLALRQIGRDLPQITMDGILTQSYLIQNPSLIRLANPSLSCAQIERLMSLTIQYHLTRIQIHQLEHALSCLQQTGSIQQFGEDLAHYHTFDPTNEPEWILFQSRTGKIFRKEQACLLHWEKETCLKEPIRIFTAPAGAGKTSVYIPANMPRLQRLGFTPFSFSSIPLYGADKVGLKELSQHIFRFDVHVLELALSTEASADDFKNLFEKLTEKGAAFKLTPTVYDAIALKYRLFLDQSQAEEVRWLRRILNHFQEHVAALVDECRINCSPFTQSKIGFGKPIPIPPIDCKVFLQIYRALTSHHLLLSDGRSISEVVQLQKNLQSTMNQSEIDAVGKTVLTHLTQDLTWLNGEEKASQKRALEMIQFYFASFETFMRLVWRMHYVHSLQKGEEIYVLARTRQATRSYYDYIYLTIVTTIQGTLQEGLGINQACQLLVKLEKTHHEQVGNSGQVSTIEQALRVWLKDPNFRLARFSLSSPSSIQKFQELVHKKTEVIFWFLEHIALRQVRLSPEYIMVSPAHFLNAFKQITLFSADPGPKEIYGIYSQGKHVRKETPFMAHAIQQFLSSQNDTILKFPFFVKAIDFFNYLLIEDPKIFSHLRMICDAGGMLRDFTVEELVQGFFAFLKDHSEVLYDGLMMYEEASDKEEETKLFLWMKGSDAPHALNGQDIPAALLALGYDWEKLNFLTFIDPSHRAGANIEQPQNSSLLFLLGEDLTLSDGVQGKLRGRGILRGNQKLIWGVSQKMSPRISSQEITPQSILEWEIHNESEKVEDEIVLSAFQQIDYWLEEPILKKLYSEDDPSKQIALWHKHRKGFVKKTDVDPLQKSTGKQAFELTEAVFWDYARKNYAQFQYTIPFEKAESMQRKLALIIENASKRKSNLPVSSRLDTRRHSHIYTFQQEKMNKVCMAKTDLHMIPEKVLPLPFEMKIAGHSFIPDLIKHSRAAQEVFGSKHLTPRLFFTNNALCTAKTGNLSLKEKYLKPVQYLLIIKQKHIWSAFALADVEAAFFQRQLTSQIDHLQLAILSADGNITQNGAGLSQLSCQMLSEPFVQDVLTDVGLARCTLLNPLRFIARIEKWHDFWPMWLKIKEGQPLPDLANVFEIEKCVPQKIKNFIPQKQSSFFGSLLEMF